MQVKELKEMLINTHNKEHKDEMKSRYFLYHYLRIFSMIITCLNKREVFNDLMEWLKFITIDQQ